MFESTIQVLYIYIYINYIDNPIYMGERNAILSWNIWQQQIAFQNSLTEVDGISLPISPTVHLPSGYLTVVQKKNIFNR